MALHALRQLQLMALLRRRSSGRPTASNTVNDLDRTSPALYDEAKNENWTIISMKNDWKRIFRLEEQNNE